jgi:hypothetical protein
VALPVQRQGAFDGVAQRDGFEKEFARSDLLPEDEEVVEDAAESLRFLKDRFD